MLLILFVLVLVVLYFVLEYIPKSASNVDYTSLTRDILHANTFGASPSEEEFIDHAIEVDELDYDENPNDFNVYKHA